MEALQQLIDGLVNHSTATLFALTILALAFLYKAREAERAENATKIQALNDRNAQTLEKVIPVAEKLADGVVTLERLMIKGDH